MEGDSWSVISAFEDRPSLPAKSDLFKRYTRKINRLPAISVLWSGDFRQPTDKDSNKDYLGMSRSGNRWQDYGRWKSCWRNLYSGRMNRSQSAYEVAYQVPILLGRNFSSKNHRQPRGWLVMLCNVYHGPICSAMHINWRSLSQASRSWGTLPTSQISQVDALWHMSRMDKG